MLTVLSLSVVSNFGTSILNIPPISFVARVGSPSRNGTVHNISSVIWGSSPISKDFCSALLTVSIFPSTNPFDLGYLGLEVLCLKSHS